MANEKLSDKDLENYQGKDKIITSYEMLDKINAKGQRATTTYNFGIRGLDANCEGFRGGELILVSGDEGEGKTTLARTIINNLERQKCQSLLFSCEERPDRLLKKFGDKIPHFLWPEEVEETTIEWMWNRYREAKIKYSKLGTIGAVVIDHLMYVTDGLEVKDLKEDLWRYCRRFKKWAVLENIAIILLHHTNRNEGKEEPSTRSFYGSGGPGKEADTALFVWRIADKDGNYGNESIIKIGKCRETGAKNIKVPVEKQGAYLVDRVEPRQMHSEKLMNRASTDND